MADQGWTKLHRCIRSSWVWNDKPFNRGSAWMDLIMMVNHEDKKLIFNGTLIEVKRGSCITSIRKLGERWGWSNKKIKLFLDQLQLDEMISYESNTKRTLVTIEKYDLYQSKETPKQHQSVTEETPKIQQSITEETAKHNKSITEAYQKHTNKNDKEYIKNYKERKEGKEGKEDTSQTFPTPIHKMAFEQFGDVAYKTWFMESAIEDKGELIIIKTEDFKKNIIQDRYLESLSILAGKKINVEGEKESG